MNIVAHNLVAMNAQRQFGIVNTKQSKTTEKLSSGYKINRAADDAAGLSISEKMRRQIRGLNQGAENIEEGIGYVQTADGALHEVQDILQRMNELAVKSANGTNTDEDREFIDEEVQQLKEELDRIFETTTFNERRIWEVTGTPKVLGYKKEQAVNSKTNYTSYDLNNNNYDVLASGSYKINADAQGISISWTGYNNTPYETKKIDWDTLEANNYSFNMGDYFKQSDTDLFDTYGTPVFNKKISFSVHDNATPQDICNSLDGVTMGHSATALMRGRFENADGSEKSGSVEVYSASIRYGAAYASRANGTDGRDFDAADDTFFEPTGGSGTVNLISLPSATTVADAKTSTEGWEFTFELDGVGTVKAQSTEIRYASSDPRTDDNENLWWEWVRYTSGGVEHKYERTIERTLAGGTLGNVMDALTGDRNSTTPGLLNDTNLGAAEKGGYIDIYFDLTADNSFTYGGGNSKDVGSCILRIDVDENDTEQTVLDKINNSLNSNTILDFYSTSGSRDSAGIGSFTANTYKIDVPIMGGACEFFVQAGAEANQHIDIVYDSLSLRELGLINTNVLTVADCDRAIGDIKEALKEVSKQRSDFGAYQNRLEHAYKSNKNVVENTQASESRIRDTDMAQKMVEYSNQNILLQAGQAMMAQANQSRQGILTLLG